MAGLAPHDLDLLGHDLPDDLRPWVKAELEPGEHVIWAARALLPPRTTSIPGRVTAALWAAALLSISGGCLYLVLGPLAERVQEVDGFLLATGLLSGIIGFFVVVGTVAASLTELGQGRGEAGPWYALTDRRAVVWEPQPDSKGIAVRAYPRGSVESVSRVEYPDGSGDVVFGLPKTAFGISPGFKTVADVRRVEKLAREVLVEKASAPHAADHDAGLPDDDAAEHY
jgi:hypothetical protein